MPLVENGQPEEINLPDWVSFRLAMMSNSAYQRVADRSKNRLAVNRLESLFTAQIDNWQIACVLWGQVITACLEEVQPTAAEVDEWILIADRTNMPIEFNTHGIPSPKAEGENGQTTA